MEDYPRTLAECEARFATEEACRAYLAKLRWPTGFICPRCGHTRAWPVRTVLWQCASCGHQTSVTASTIFDGPRAPLTTWFRAMWYVTSQKTGTSALSLQQVLGLRSYQRLGVAAQAAPGHGAPRAGSGLAGQVEVDETLVGGLGGARGRSTATKALVVVAAEEVGRGIGRIRMARIPDGSAETLEAFVAEAIEPGSGVHTDGWPGYTHLEANGYHHRVTPLRGDHALASELLPRVHRVVSLLKRWLLGTHHGGVSRAHLDAYLDEFTVRFNRRRSRHRGKLFFRLVQQAVTLEPVPYEQLIQRGRRR